MKKFAILPGILTTIVALSSCGGGETPQPQIAPAVTESAALLPARPEVYAPFTLVSELDGLSERQKQMLVLLIEASQIMDDLFWRQAFGDGYQEWLASIGVGSERRFAELNYGPWDRLNDEAPFIAGVGEKPLGARFYPQDMTKDEFEAADLPGKDSLYTFVRRDESGALTVVPFHVEFADELGQTAALLRQAAALAEHEGFANYLRLRADALLGDDFQESDFAWMDVKSNPIELVIGPIETYEDRLFGYKAAYESYVLVKDQAWSERLAKFAAFLPELQRDLPVDDAYKAETPGTDSDLNADRKSVV